jgi:hypothetical protein
MNREAPDLILESSGNLAANAMRLARILRISQQNALAEITTEAARMLRTIDKSPMGPPEQNHQNARPHPPTHQKANKNARDSA